MQPKEIDAGIRAGLDLFEKVTLPYSDGLFYLRGLLFAINEGQIGLMPMQRNAEGQMVPAVTQKAETPFGPADVKEPESD